MGKSELEIIREVLQTVDELEVRELKKLPTVDIPHSEEFTRNMEKLLAGDWEWKRRSRARVPIAAAIAAAVLLSLTITAVAFGDRISNFFEEVFDRYTNLEKNDASTDFLDKIYLPTYIPEGYEQTCYSVGLVTLDVTWEKDTEQIVYSQSALNVGNLTIDTEGSECTTVTVEGVSIRRVIKNGTYLLVWEDGSYCYQLQCPAELSWEQIEMIIESIR